MKKAQPRQTLNGHSIFSSENAQDAYYKGGGYMAPILPMHFDKGTQIFRDTTSLPFKDGGQLYTYSGRPGATYQKVNGQWYIHTEHTNGEFIPVKDPTGKRTALLNAQAKPMATTTNKYQRTYDPLLDNKPQTGETTQKVAQDYMMAKDSKQYAEKSMEAQARAQAEKSPEQIANEVSASSLKNSLTPEEKALAKEYFNNPEYNYYHDPIRGVREGNVTAAQSFGERMDELVWPAFQPFTGNPSFEKTKLQEFEKNKVKRFQTLDDAMKAVYAQRVANNRGQSDTRLTPSEEMQLRASMPTPGQMASGRAAPVDWLWAAPIAGPAALEMLGGLGAMSVPGMSAVPGATVGNLVNSGFIANSLMQAPSNVKSWYDVSQGKKDWQDAALESGEIAAGMIGSGAGLKSLAQDALQGTKAVKNAYNEVATGNSILPYAWKSPMKNMTAKSSENIFNNVLQSNKFTDAEKQIISEYANNSGPFTGRFGYVNEAKRAELQKVIDKAKVEFPNDIVLSRKINANNPDLFNLENNVLNIGNRPTSFSAGIGDTGSGFGSSAKDRIVLSGKNAKKVENNFLKNTYENPSQEYLQTLNPQEHPYGFLEAMNNRSLEKELIGSGFDLKKVGKVKNELGGHDYIMKPIKSKTPVKSNNVDEALDNIVTDLNLPKLPETFNYQKGLKTMNPLEKAIDKQASEYVKLATSEKNYERARALDKEYGTEYVKGLDDLKKHHLYTSNSSNIWNDRLPLNIKIVPDEGTGAGGWSGLTKEGQLKNKMYELGMGPKPTIFDREIAYVNNADSASEIKRRMNHEIKHHYTLGRGKDSFYNNEYGNALSDMLNTPAEISKTNPEFADALIQPAFKDENASLFEYYESPPEIDAYVNTNLRDELVDSKILKDQWDELTDEKLARFLMGTPQKQSKRYLDMVKDEDFIKNFNKGVYSIGIPAAVGGTALLANPWQQPKQD